MPGVGATEMMPGYTPEIVVQPLEPVEGPEQPEHETVPERPAFSHQLKDGTVVTANTEEEVFAGCSVMREMAQKSPELASMVLKLAARGNEIMEAAQRPVKDSVRNNAKAEETQKPHDNKKAEKPESAEPGAKLPAVEPSTLETALPAGTAAPVVPVAAKLIKPPVRRPEKPQPAAEQYSQELDARLFEPTDIEPSPVDRPIAKTVEVAETGTITLPERPDNDPAQEPAAAARRRTEVAGQFIQHELVMQTLRMADQQAEVPLLAPALEASSIEHFELSTDSESPVEKTAQTGGPLETAVNLHDADIEALDLQSSDIETSAVSAEPAAEVTEDMPPVEAELHGGQAVTFELPDYYFDSEIEVTDLPDLGAVLATENTESPETTPELYDYEAPQPDATVEAEPLYSAEAMDTYAALAALPQDLPEITPESESHQSEGQETAVLEQLIAGDADGESLPEAIPVIIASEGQESAFVDFIDAHTEDIEPMPIADISRQASAEPAELTLARLARLLEQTSPASGLDWPDDILDSLDGLASALMNRNSSDGQTLESANTSTLITPEAIRQLVILLHAIGYENPKEEILRCSRLHGLPFLLQMMQYLSELKQTVRPELLAAASATSNDDQDSARLRLGKLLFGLITRRNFGLAA